MSNIAKQKKYLKENITNIDEQNYFYLKQLTYIGLSFFIVFFIFFAIMRSNSALLIKYLISIGVYIVFLGFLHVYKHRVKRIEHSVVEGALIFFILFSLMVAATISLPNGKAYSAMLPILIITFSMVLVTRWYKILACNIVVSLLYILFCIFYFEKDITVIFTDCQNILISLVLAVVLNQLSMNLRVKEFEAKMVLEKLAAIDELTNLPNRRMFNRFLEHTFNNNDRPIGVLMLDIDDFKQINDKYGHQIGDKVLGILGHFLADIANSRNDLFAARYGGEEFSIITSGMNPDEFYDVGVELIEKIKEIKIEELNNNYITLSCGYDYHENLLNTSIDDVVLGADKALYKAKNNGKNQIVRFQDMK